ncbi:MAG: hypothetical protein MUF05_07455 [Candidatus Omnitrophica bacterium]|nr:hypothetical protein [Candidatus Omnitrophota bacterium]
MAKKDEINLLKAFISNARKSTDSIVIALGKESARELKQKNIDFSALRPIKNKDGFEAYLNIGIEKLTHNTISQKILDGIPYEEATKQKDHFYLKGSPELILRMPLEANEEEKIRFLRKANKYYKDLVKGRRLSNGKIEIITHRPKKGKRTKLIEEYKKRESWIKKRINELRKNPNPAKVNVIFKQVGEEAPTKFTFCKSLTGKPLSPSTVRNIYYSK